MRKIVLRELGANCKRLNINFFPKTNFWFSARIWAIHWPSRGIILGLVEYIRSGFWVEIGGPGGWAPGSGGSAGPAAQPGLAGQAILDSSIARAF
jgi:hypothetical protein